MVAAKKMDPPNDGDGDWVYTRSFRHWKTGRIVYAKPGKVFRFRRRK